MSNIDNGFSIEVISLGDKVLVTAGETDPRVSGYEAPDGSLYILKNGTSSVLLIKRGPLDTNWLQTDYQNGVWAYAGANADITSMSALTGGIATPDYVRFDTLGSPAVPQTGDLYWGAVDGTFNMTLLNGVTLQVGQETQFYGKANEIISNGQVCMFVGAEGDHPLFAPATGSVINEHPEYLIGVATQNFVKGQFGYITCFGKVRDLNTSLWAEGTVLYADIASTGGLTPTPPQAPNVHIPIASVMKSHTNKGSLLVRVDITGGLRALQDVRILSTPQDKQALMYNASASVWEPTTPVPIATVDATAPTNPSIGQLWYDQTNAALKIYLSGGWTTV